MRSRDHVRYVQLLQVDSADVATLFVGPNDAARRLRVSWLAGHGMPDLARNVVGFGLPQLQGLSRTRA